MCVCVCVCACVRVSICVSVWPTSVRVLFHKLVCDALAGWMAKLLIFGHNQFMFGVWRRSFPSCVVARYINPLNAGLNPICKSQLAEFFCGIFKFCAWYSKNLNISRTKRDKSVKQKDFCGEGNRQFSVCLQMLEYHYRVMEKNCFWKKIVNILVILLKMWSRIQLFVRRTDE